VELFKHGKVYDFMAIRAYWIAFSLFAAAVSLFSATVWPLPTYGTDFKGGTEVEIAFTKTVDAAGIRSAVHRAGFTAPDVVSVTDPANPNRFLIRVQETSSLDEHKREALQKALCYAAADDALDASCAGRQRASEVKFSPGGDKIFVRYDQEPELSAIGPAVQSVGGVELRPAAHNPQVVSQRDHKVEIQLKSKGDQLMDGLRRELGADTVPENPLRVEWVGPKAGKQLRDAAVVYDRIRENLGKHRGKTFAQIINLSVSETLSRTLLTSGATLLSILAFFVWGTGVIKDFALALLIGIVAGTYSSIYVAAPLTEWIDKRFFGGAASGGARRPAGAPRAQGKKTAAVV